MARPKKHENGSEQITCRVPIELKQKVLREVEARPGVSISDVVVEALALHGSKTVALPEVLQRRADKHAVEAGISFNELVSVAITALLDGPTVDPVRIPDRPTMPPLPVGVIEKARAADKAGFGKSVADFLGKNPAMAMARPDPMYSDPGNWPTDEVPTLEKQERGPSWSVTFAKAKAQGDFGAEYFEEQVAHITRWPAGFKGWPVPKQVGWLDENHQRKAEG